LRLRRVEELVQSNRKELDIQLQRIADLQALLDSPTLDRRRGEAPAKPASKES
jgi:hypothetical protein